ncbi:hypothetical protein ACFRDU_41715, partial [Streptomyces sp. NPDC056661]
SGDDGSNTGGYCDGGGGTCSSDQTWEEDTPAETQAYGPGTDNTVDGNPAATDVGDDGAGAGGAGGVMGSEHTSGADGAAGAPGTNGLEDWIPSFVFAGVTPEAHVGPIGVGGELVAFAGTDATGENYAGYLGAVTAAVGPVEAGYGAEWSSNGGVAPVGIVESKVELGPGLSISLGSLGSHGQQSPYISINPGPFTFGIGVDF